MLESMVHSSRPTRAEVTDVANAIFDGTDAVMLSQETAVGRYPVEAVAMMASIAETTERELPYARWLTERARPDGDESATIAFGAVGAVYQLDLKAIVVPTITGRTAALISAHRPPVPILALSPRIDVVRRLSLLWGVRAELNEEPSATTELLEECAEFARRIGIAKPGERDRNNGRPAGRLFRRDEPVQGAYALGAGRRSEVRKSRPEPQSRPAPCCRTCRTSGDQLRLPANAARKSQELCRGARARASPSRSS